MASLANPVREMALVMWGAKSARISPSGLIDPGQIAFTRTSGPQTFARYRC